MLVPLLEGARTWVVPPQTEAVFRATHFAQRATERGVVSVPGYLLAWLVCEALDTGRADLIEPVFRLDPEAVLYRVLLPEGAFYPVVRGARPVTLYTAAEKRNLRFTRRMRKRTTGCRSRRTVAT